MFTGFTIGYMFSVKLLVRVFSFGKVSLKTENHRWRDTSRQNINSGSIYIRWYEMLQFSSNKMYYCRMFTVIENQNSLE